MRSLAVGCVGLIIGMIVGTGLVILANSTAFKPAPSIAPPIAYERSDLSVTVSATFAADQIQQVIRQSGVAKNATVGFASPNLIRVATSVDVNALGVPLSVNVTVAMRVTAQRGRIVLTTDRVDAGGYSLPTSVIDSTVEPVRAKAEEQINRIAQRELQGTNLYVSDIRITADALTVEMSTQ